MKSEIDQFLSANGLVPDPSRPELGNIITSPLREKQWDMSRWTTISPFKRKRPIFGDPLIRWKVLALRRALLYHGIGPSVRHSKRNDNHGKTIHPPRSLLP